MKTPPLSVPAILCITLLCSTALAEPEFSIEGRTNGNVALYGVLKVSDDAEPTVSVTVTQAKTGEVRTVSGQGG